MNSKKWDFTFTNTIIVFRWIFLISCIFFFTLHSLRTAQHHVLQTSTKHSLWTTYYHFKAMHLYWAICLNVSRWHDFMELMLLPALFPCSPILRTIVLQISKLLFKSFTAHSCLLNAGKKIHREWWAYFSLQIC